MNLASIGATNFKGSAIGRPVSSASACAYASRSRCTGAGSSMVSFTGLSSEMAPSLSFAYFRGFLSFVGFEDEIKVDDHADRETRPDRERRLNIEITLDDFLPGLIHAFARPAAKRLDDIAVVTGIRAGSQFAANAEQRGRSEER